MRLDIGGVDQLSATIEKTRHRTLACRADRAIVGGIANVVGEIAEVFHANREAPWRGNVDQSIVDQACEDRIVPDCRRRHSRRRYAQGACRAVVESGMPKVGVVFGPDAVDLQMIERRRDVDRAFIRK